MEKVSSELFSLDWYARVSTVLGNIRTERERQHVKFGGTQSHTLAVWFTILGEEFGEASKEALEAHLSRNWTETEKLIQNCREELVQVAAVACAMVEAIDRGVKPS